MSEILEKTSKLGGSQSPSLVDTKDKEIEKPIVFQHFGKVVRLGSRKIKILEVPAFSLLPKGPEAKEIRDEVVKKIGSQWKKGTRDLIRGLTEQEELYYLPRVLGVSTESDNWNDKVLNFWADFTISVPPGDKGIEIEVGFKEATKKDSIRGNAEPISLEGYMRFGFCQANGDVATTDEELDNPYHMKFFIVDVARDQVSKEQRFEEMKLVNRKFTKLVSATDEASRYKIDWLLETVGGDDEVGINIMNLNTIQREMELEKFKDRNPKLFEEMLDDPNLETKALIRKSVERSVLTQEGNAYFLDSKMIGSTLLEAVGYLTNPANQMDKMRIVSRLKDSSK